MRSLYSQTGRNLDQIKEDWEFYKGNFRKHWIGITPDTSTEIGRKNSDAIDRLFQSANIIEGLIDYHVAALIGNEPAITVEGSQSEAMDDLIRSVWRNWIASQSGEGFSDPVTLAVTRAKATGYGYLRVWMPDKMRSGELSKQVAIHSPSPESVKIDRDDNGFIDKIHYTFTQDKERWTETQYINDQGLTVFEYYRSLAIASSPIQPNPEEIDRSFVIDLKGRYTIYEIKLKPLINDSMKRNQNAINHGLTMIPRGNELSGFLARFFSNAKPPGKWQTNPDGTTTFEPDPDGMVIGAGIVNFVSGLPVKDLQGNTTGYTPVGVHTDPPMPIGSFKDSFELFSGIMHLQANQGHLLSFSLALSGRSREELKSDFVTAVTKDAMAVESAISNSLGVAITLLGISAIVTARLKLNFGKPTPEERRAILETVRDGLMSKQTAIALLGYSDDPLAELELIQSEAREVDQGQNRISRIIS